MKKGISYGIQILIWSLVIFWVFGGFHNFKLPGTSEKLSLPEVKRFTPQELATFLTRGGLVLSEDSLNKIIGAVEVVSVGQSNEVKIKRAIGVAFLRQEHTGIGDETIAAFVVELERAFPSNFLNAVDIVNDFLSKHKSLETDVIEKREYSAPYRMAILEGDPSAEIFKQLKSNKQ